MRWLRFTLVLVLAACGGPADDEIGGSAGAGSGSVCDAGQFLLADTERCIEAGMQPDGCPAGSRWVDGRAECVQAGIDDNGCPSGTLIGSEGSCEPAGILAGDCAVGFMADGTGGCTAVLPTSPCPTGELALPGETSCHPVASCGAPPWGGIPVAMDTVYVDGAANGQQDGTTANPFNTIQQAVDAAGAGAIVAIAPGSYVEDVVIEGKAVQLWSSCPTTTSIVGSSVALAVGAGADGSEVHHIALTGAGVGLDVRGASQVTAGGIWVHDTAGEGVTVFEAAPGSSLTLTGALIEGCGHTGLWVSGGTAVVDATVVRDTLPVPSQGFGITVEQDETTQVRGSATVTGSLLERNAEAGVIVHAADFSIQASVIRDTQPNETNRFGRGMQIQTAGGSAASEAVIRDVIIDGAYDGGIVIAASHAVIERTVVRNVAVNQDVGDKGLGIGIQHDPITGSQSSAEITRSLIERTHDTGILAGASLLTARGVIVRDTEPTTDGLFGRGVGVQLGLGDFGQAAAELEGCVIENNRDLGVFVQGADASLERVLVDGTTARPDGLYGYALGIQDGETASHRSDVAIRYSSLEHSQEMAVFAAGCDFEMESSVVADVAPQAASGLLGRGLNFQDNHLTGEPTNVVLKSSLVRDTYDVAIMVGGSTATIEGVRIERTLPAPGGTFGGRALNVQLDALSQRRGDAQLRYSHIADSADAAVFVGDGTLSVQASVIDQTQASDGLFGDGVVAVTIDLPSVLVIQGSRVSGSVRAGLSVFGSALTLSDSAMSCNGIDIAAEPHEAFTADLTDAGGNRCGCASDEVCRAISAQLAPPEPTDVLE